METKLPENKKRHFKIKSLIEFAHTYISHKYELLVTSFLKSSLGVELQE